MAVLLRSVLASLVLVLLLVGPAHAEPVRVVLLHLNDWDRMEEKDGAGGAARIAAAIKAETARAPATVVTYGGDMISPSLLSGFDKGRHMIDLANRVGLEVAALGNHEFDFGPAVLAERIGESRFAWLAANLERSDGSVLPGVAATHTRTVGGLKIGFIGLTTPETAVLSSPGKSIRFSDPVEAARRAVARLKAEQVDLIVALTHLGYRQDLALLKAVPEIAIVLGGHDHLGFAYWDGRQAALSAASQGELLGVVEIAAERVTGRDGKQRLAWRPAFRLVSTATVEPDPEIKAVVAGHLASLGRELHQPVGETAVELDTRRATVRGGEARFGNLLADAQRAAVEADVAIFNGGGIRGDKLYPAGTMLTRRDILAELPFGNRTAKVRITGAQLRAALENGVSQAEKGAGRYPQVSGLTFTFGVKKPPGKRVASVTVGGKPLDPAATYTVAASDYLVKGGDGYGVLGEGELLIDPEAGQLVAYQLIDHLAKLNRIAPDLEGRSRRLD